jgi:hypothetical protein
MKQEIMDCFTWYANKVAETVQYESWSNEFCRKENEVNTHMFLEELNEHINWDTLTREEARELRFVVYSDDTPNLFLIPLYILPILPIGTELVSINGNRIIYDGSNVDKDTRYGCLAFGIVIEDN